MQRKRRRGAAAALPEAGPPTRIDLEFQLLGNAERVVDLDTKVTDSAFEPCVSERVGFILRVSFLIENQRVAAHRSVLAVATGCAGR